MSERARAQDSDTGPGTGKGIQPGELGFLVALAGGGSLSATARELGLSKAAVSKRLAGIEARTGVILVNRTTRRMSLTPEGQAVVDRARAILAEIDEIDRVLLESRRAPQGLLRVNATLGFGRSHVAPVISRFVRRHPGVEVQLQLSVNPPPLTDEAYDVCICFGPPPDARVLAQRLAPNRRLLCAAPGYLQRYGQPTQPADLQRHRCIVIRQGDQAYGTWRLSSGRGSRRREAVVKIRPHLSTNDGEIAVAWALDGHGILMRAEWDIARHLKSGRLLPVLPQWETPAADIHAVWPQRLQLSTRVRSFVDFIADAFATGSNPSVPTPPSDARGAAMGQFRP